MYVTPSCNCVFEDWSDDLSRGSNNSDYQKNKKKVLSSSNNNSDYQKNKKKCCRRLINY